MEVFLFSSVLVLVALAMMDIIVGVGNDAVNFLNSAIGSRVAKFNTIMWVATAGIIVVSAASCWCLAWQQRSNMGWGAMMRDGNLHFAFSPHRVACLQ